ncbi:TetR/AcrR family transcriptional regulator [Formosa sp. A9]|uniref:TetR/AcrR family transcriptional regulator n=1 Tax=Formosa sp. A9 TaxID=3442641 RepID=UPI003EC0E1E4
MNRTREEKKKKTRASILKASLKLFSEKGLENTSISDIVEVSNIGRGTFYNYYKTSTDVFCDILETLNQDIDRDIKAAQAGVTDVYQFLFVSFKAYFDLVSTEDMVLFHMHNQNQIRKLSYTSDSIINVVNNLKDSLMKFEHITFKSTEFYKMFSLVAISSASELFICLHQGYFETSKDTMAHFLADLFVHGLEGLSEPE